MDPADTNQGTARRSPCPSAGSSRPAEGVVDPRTPLAGADRCLHTMPPPMCFAEVSLKCSQATRRPSLSPSGSAPPEQVTVHVGARNPNAAGTRTGLNASAGHGDFEQAVSGGRNGVTPGVLVKCLCAVTVGGIARGDDVVPASRGRSRKARRFRLRPMPGEDGTISWPLAILGARGQPDIRRLGPLL